MTQMTGVAGDSPLHALWPEPGQVRSTWVPRPSATDYLALPSAASPRVLVPIGAPGADRLLGRSSGPRRTRAARGLVRFAARSGLLGWLPGPRLRVAEDRAGIEAHLGSVFDEPIRIGVRLGPPRANLKPVLQVFGPGGEVLGFAKVGATPATAPLLAGEASALRWLSENPVPGMTVPRVLDYDTWRGIPVLVQSPLPMAQAGRQPSSFPVAQLAALAVSGGVTTTVLGDSAFWARVRDVGEGRWHGLDTSAFARLRDEVDTSAELALGAWHGDFGPWNAAAAGSGRLEVWDWERFEDDVPIGLDAAHWRIQVEFGRGRAPADCWTAMTEDVAELVRHAGVRTDVPVAAASYLLTIWGRYRQVGPDLQTPALRRRITWLASIADVATSALAAGR